MLSKLLGNETRMKKTAWLLDEEHSSIVFIAKHMLISSVTGQFKVFEVKVVTDEDNFDAASIKCIIYTSGLTTNDDYRDDHLKSEALFDVKSYPEIKFKSASFKRISEGSYLLIGKLKIKDISQTIEIPIKYLGKKNSNGMQGATFNSNFVINREDFNLTYNPLLESGGMVVGKEISITVSISLIKNED